MKTNKWLTVLCFLVATYALQAQTNSEIAQVINKMVGSWESTNGEYTMHETWSKSSDYHGQGIVKKGSDTLFTEQLRIMNIAGHWCYIATPQEQKPVLFYLMTSTEDELVFVNPEHDFPQKITYHIPDRGNMTAIVEGSTKKGDKKDVYNFERID